MFIVFLKDTMKCGQGESEVEPQITLSQLIFGGLMAD